mmetsp:Transcript_25825/g.58217  ORF Transcript_25825/g.58217 Transcript_25825/m.58217 type:complete len:214 (+) Transcript_25825:695-1336(+)
MSSQPMSFSSGRALEMYPSPLWSPSSYGRSTTSTLPWALASISSSSFVNASSGAARTLHPTKTGQSLFASPPHHPCPLGSKQHRWLWQICSHSQEPVVLDSFVGVQWLSTLITMFLSSLVVYGVAMDRSVISESRLSTPGGTGMYATPSSDPSPRGTNTPTSVLPIATTAITRRTAQHRPMVRRPGRYTVLPSPAVRELRSPYSSNVVPSSST